MIDKNAIGKEPKTLKTWNVIKKIFNILLSIIFIAVILVNVVLIIKTFTNPEETPDFFGYKFFVITSGSMEPTIHVGDFIVVKEVEKSQINVQDIITFQSGKTVVTHRIINIANKEIDMEITTKGDNNNVEDNNKVKEKDIEGKYVFTIPILGNIVLWSQTVAGLATLIIVPVLVFILVFWKNQRAKTKQIERDSKREKYKKI